MKQKVLGTGLSGLIGSRISELLSHKYELINLDLSNPTQPVDILDERSVQSAVASSAAIALIHAAAFTDVSAAWQQTGDKSGLAYRVNVMGTENVVKAAKSAGLYMIHLSTAYVFDGQKPTPYLESDQPRPIEWYGQTKLAAEEIVQNTLPKALILRIDQPFRATPHARPDVLRRIASQLQANNLPPQFTDHHMGPTSIEDLVKIVDWSLQTQPAGIFHASQGEAWTDYDFAQTIAQLLELDPQLVKPGLLAEYQKQSVRPYQVNTALDTAKLRAQLPFTQLTVREALETAVATF